MTPAARPSSALDRAWPAGAAAAVGLAAAAVALLGPRLDIGPFGAWSGAAAGLAAIGAAALVFAPGRAAPAVFVAGMMLMHQFRSLFILPAGGAEWHPRELLLFLLLAHAAARALARPVRLGLDPAHLCLMAYAAAYAAGAFSGLFALNDLREIVEELRYPVFLAAYPALIACNLARRDLHNALRLMLAVAACTAAAGIAYFLYCLATGQFVSVQNALGEFVQRLAAGRLLQSVRPAGHLYFEVALVALASLAAAQGLALRRRLACLPLMALFACAIAITMMRTAYIATTLSFAVLALLALPPALRAAALAAGAAAAAAALAAAGPALLEAAAGALPGAGVSLQARAVEVEGAWRGFLEYPLFGAGFGSSFEAIGLVADRSLESYARAQYQTLHNVWMYLLYKTGLVGTLLALAGLGGLILRGAALAARLDAPFDRALLRGLTAAFAGQCIASLAMPRLTYPEGHVLVCLYAAALVVYAGQARASTTKA